MLLFYSEHCQYSNMLLETVRRHDAQNEIRTVSIESLRASGHKVPPQIHAVPALMIKENGSAKPTFMYGKAVFDFLLLPGTGLLMRPRAKTAQSRQASEQQNPFESMAFSINHTKQSTDNFAPIDDSDGALSDRGYAWTNIQDIAHSTPDKQLSIMAEETRTKKALPDISTFRAQRDVELSM